MKIAILNLLAIVAMLGSAQTPEYIPKGAKEYHSSGYTSTDVFWSAVKRNQTASSAQGQAYGVIAPGFSTTTNGFQLTAPTTNGYPTLSLTLSGAGAGLYAPQTSISPATPASFTAPLLNFPPLPSTLTSSISSHWLNPHIKDIGINMRGAPAPCVLAYAWFMGTMDNVSCLGSTLNNVTGDTSSGSAWIAFGTVAMANGGYGACPASTNCLGLNYFTHNVLVWSGSNAGPADLTVTLSGSTVASIAVSGYDGSRHYANPGPLPVLFKCGDGTLTCYASGGIPVAYATMAADGAGLYTVSSITVTTAGSGITANLVAALPDTSSSAFGIDVDSADSTFYDLQAGETGAYAGIHTRAGASNAFYHPHPWGEAKGIWDFNYGHYFNAAELDSLVQAGFAVSGNTNTSPASSTVIDSPTIIYGTDAGSGIFSSVHDLELGSGAVNVTWMNQRCTNLNPNSGYYQFINGSGLPVDVGYGWSTSSYGGSAFGLNMLNPGFTVFNSHKCASDPAPSSGVYIESRGLDSTDPNRIMTFTTGNTAGAEIATPFLLAEMPAPNAPTTLIHSSLTVTLTGGLELGDKARLVILLANENGTLKWSTSGSGPQDLSSASGTGIYLRAYRDATTHMINLYLYTGSNSVASVRFDGVLDSNTHLEPHPMQVAPSGSLVYDSSDPVTYNDGLTWASNIYSRTGSNLILSTKSGGNVLYGVNNANIAALTSTYFGPLSGATLNLGQSTMPWQNVYATTVTSTGTKSAAVVGTDSSGAIVSSAIMGTVSSASGTTVTHNFSSAMTSLRQCQLTPTSNSGFAYLTAENTTGVSITYATSGAASFNVVCYGAGGAW